MLTRLLPYPLPHPKLLIEATELRPPTQPFSRSQSFAPGSNTRISSPKLGSASMPPTRQIEDGRRAMANTFLAASDPRSRNLHRSNTWAGDMSDLLTSDAPVGDETRTRNGSRKRVGVKTRQGQGSRPQSRQASCRLIAIIAERSKRLLGDVHTGEISHVPTMMSKPLSTMVRAIIRRPRSGMKMVQSRRSRATRLPKE